MLWPSWADDLGYRPGWLLSLKCPLTQHWGLPSKSPDRKDHELKGPSQHLGARKGCDHLGAGVNIQSRSLPRGGQQEQ